MKKILLISSTFLGMTAVILGAMGAHWLKTQLDASSLAAFETGVRYQMYHAILLLALGLWLKDENNRLLYTAYWSLLIGVVFFSGSIYLLSTSSMTGLGGINFLGPITPLGGLLMITGWFLLLLHFIRKK